MNAILRSWRKHDPKRLIITGYADRPTIDMYQTATDICLAPYLPTFNLSASAALTWALTSGRPVIASGIPAFEDINRAGDCLLTVMPGAAPELAWAVERLARDETLQQRLVEKAQAYAEARSWKVAAVRNQEVYEEVLARRTRSRLFGKVPAHDAAPAADSAQHDTRLKLAG
jgi:glycosyltransferase involved in cell wall biosynthesis